MTYDNLYYTDDAEHAAFLLASKQVIESFYWAKGSCVFVFEGELKCEKIIDSILKGEYHIEALSLLEAFKTINNILSINIII
jgi:hypothetical protein